MARLSRARAHAGLESDERAYGVHERAVMGMLSSRYRDLDHDSRYELYHEAWTSVLRRRAAGVEIANLEGYLVCATDKLASKRTYGADARRRVTFDPTDSPFAHLADAAETPEESALAADEARRIRMLIDELDGAERAVLKLRLDLGFEPAEIRERLGLTERGYRRVVERAGKSLLAQFAAFDSGEWARRKRSLLCACVFGVATERQQERARRLVAEDPCCRAMMSELRALGGRAAMALPLPAGPSAAAVAGADGGRPAEMVAGAHQQVSELLARARESAAGAYARVSDPTPLAGARPGAVATVLAGCLAAAGGGTYCAVEGVPDPLRPALGIERAVPQASEGAREPAPPEPAPRPPPAASEPAPAIQKPAQAPAPEQSPPAPTPPAAPTPPPAPADEFQPAPAASFAAAPAPPPAPTEPRPPASGGGESTEFQP